MALEHFNNMLHDADSDYITNIMNESEYVITK